MVDTVLRCYSKQLENFGLKANHRQENLVDLVQRSEAGVSIAELCKRISNIHPVGMCSGAQVWLSVAMASTARPQFHRAIQEALRAQMRYAQQWVSISSGTHLNIYLNH